MEADKIEQLCGSVWLADNYTHPVEANEALSEWLIHGILKVKHAQLPSQEELNDFVEQITEDFYQHFGKWPNHYNLVLLSEVCLAIHNTDRAKTKNKNICHPYLTTRQLQTRLTKEFPMSDVILDIQFNKRIHGRLPLPYEKYRVRSNVTFKIPSSTVAEAGKLVISQKQM